MRVAILAAARLLMNNSGELHSTTDEKKSPGDFVLWKKSKPGEPSWSSPWGEVCPFFPDCAVGFLTAGRVVLDGT